MSPFHFTAQLEKSPRARFIGSSENPGGHLTSNNVVGIKFMFSKKATKINEIFTVYLTLCSKCQIDGEDFINFCDLLRKHEL